MKAKNKETLDKAANELVKQQKISDILISLVLKRGCKFFLDQFGEPQVQLPDRPAIGYSVSGAVFKRWVSGIYWEDFNEGFSNEIFSQVMAALEGKSQHEGIKISLFNRIAKIEETISYDIGDDVNIVEITPSGWEVVKAKAPLFRRFTHQKVQSIPEKGGALGKILDYVNLKNSEDKILFLTYLVAILFCDIPRAMIIATGEQGSAKSTLLRVIRKLIDPSRVDLLKMRSAVDELTQMASHHYCLYFDNLSYLSTESSDSLSGFVTGLGFSKRKLFSDDSDIIFELLVAVGLNGINLVAEKADLLDRSLIFTLERISDLNRKEESKFWIDFEKEKPQILGSLFDIASQVLKTKEDIELPTRPRMADYARVAAAAAVSLGYKVDGFLQAYEKNIARQNKAAIDASPVAQTILEFMSIRDEWSGASSDLFTELSNLATANKLEVGGSYGFPKSATWLWRKINLIKTNLAAMGISVTHGEEITNNTITLKKTKNASVNLNASIENQPQNGSMEALEGDQQVDDRLSDTNTNHTGNSEDASYASNAPIQPQKNMEASQNMFPIESEVESV
jgi:hypothetical protein